jgi:hypothetical protein
MSQPNSTLTHAHETNPDPNKLPTLNGVEHAGVIDFMGFDDKTGEVLMLMIERRPWAQAEVQLFQLQEKLNAYLSFILDGEMAEAYPDLMGKPIRIRLECATPPTNQELFFLQHVHDQLALQSIAFEVEVAAPEGTNNNCGCGQPLSECCSD